MPSVVIAEALTKRWGSTTVIDSASFTIEPGITGLLGANGAGKTTFFGMVLGLHRAEAGRLNVLGHDPWQAGPAVRTRLGYSPEHEALPPDVRAHDFVRHVAELHGIPSRQAVARASDALYEVDLGEERFRQLGTMSTGQKQRVKLAQAIVHDPALVLLDEPTNGLDPVQRDHMLELIKRCGHDLGLNVVLSSHLLDEVERTCDRVVILANGKVSVGAEMADIESQDNEVQIEIDGDVHAFEVVAERLGLNLAGPPDGATLRYRLDGEATFDLLAQAVDTAGVGVRRLRRARRTLTDAFLEASQ